MPVLFKGLQILSFLGAASSVPFIPSLTESTTVPETKLTSSGGAIKKVLIPSPIPEPRTLPKSVPVVMEQAMEEMAVEKGKGVKGTAGLGCFWIPGFPAELFFCFDKGELGSAPYLYHYSWKGGRGRGTESPLQKIENITRGFTANLKRGAPRPILGKTKVLLNWVSRWQEGSPFNPSQHCRITLNEEKGYKVTCSLPSVSSEQGYSWKGWESEISHKDIVEPSNKLEIKKISE